MGRRKTGIEKEEKRARKKAALKMRRGQLLGQIRQSAIEAVKEVVREQRAVQAALEETNDQAVS